LIRPIRPNRSSQIVDAASASPRSSGGSRRPDPDSDDHRLPTPRPLDPLFPFRIRGREVTRLEAFSDAVFGFAATLLVVSLEVPRSYDALIVSLRGFVPFAACFALLIWIWSVHNGFFRRYGMQDPITTTINAALLFVVLFFVYPMRVVLTSFVERIMWGMGFIRATEFTFDLSGSMDQLANLFAIYSAGFASIFFCFVLLYHRAIRKAVALDLDELERYDAATRRGEMALYSGVGLLGVVIGVTGVGKGVALGGWVFGLLGPLGAGWGYYRGRRREALEPTNTLARTSGAPHAHPVEQTQG
jgi:uncharacterized membrane protein